MYESDMDNSQEDKDQPVEDLLPEDAAATEEAGESSSGEPVADSAQGDESPWSPPSEDEHRALLDIKDKTESILEELLRAKADFENYKKRKTREAARDRAAAVRGFLEGLLPVIDNFERAIESADSQDGEAGGLLEGVGLIHQMIFKLLDDHDVSVVEAEGRSFDPDFHEAVFEEEVTVGSTGDVLEVLEKGYLHGEVLIRPSRVKVAKRVEPQEDAGASEDSES